MSETRRRTRVAVLFPGPITDGSWSQFGYEGLVKAEAECGLEIAFTDSVPADRQLEAFRQYAGEEYQILIGHGGEFSQSAHTAAQEFRNLQFGVTNGKFAGGNLSSIKISYAQMGYLRGALAAAMTKTKKIGMVSGYKAATVTRDEEAFTRAARNSDDKIECVFAYTGDMEDVDKARLSARDLIDQGIDVITHHLDSGERGVMSEAQNRGIFAIGLYRDSSPLAPNVMIGSALGSPGTLVYELAGGRALTGTTSFMDVHTPQGIDLHMTDLVPKGIQKSLSEIVAKMKAGEIFVEP